MPTKKLSIDEYDLRHIIMNEMFKFFCETGISWLYGIRDRKRDPNGFMKYRFMLPANRIIARIKEAQPEKEV